ncbi:histidyl-tRNA synthetase [Babesia ovis]|uniref:histidine--tRNA ligase n=1 Tax=Babesia ovis TaxID=5869 RepID=A0A9W5WTR7_BABOV|nr:histidyl-tRNA synthetase [Babesia ovis]
MACQILLIAIAAGLCVCLGGDLRRTQRPLGYLAPRTTFCGTRARLYADARDKVALYTVRGGQCFLPRDQSEQRRLQQEWIDLSQKFGFAEYSIGVLAHAELFNGSQEDGGTEEHRKEQYTFTDRKGRRLALRGDVTPQFMAMLRDQWESCADRSQGGGMETRQYSKWFTLADCWRYERPGYCRRRNHLQWTCDIVGSPKEDAEIELLTMLVTFFRKRGLSSADVAIHLSHRDAVPAMLDILGKPTTDERWMHEFRKVVDKYRKVDRSELSSMLSALGFTPEEISKLFNLISRCHNLATLSELFHKETPFVGNLKNIVEGLERAQCADWITIDLSIVRGSDYYTGAVFECFDRLHPQHRAIAGGGRYDNYFRSRVPSDGQLAHAVGFGMGNIGMIEVLRSRGLLAPETLADVVVFSPPMGNDEKALRGCDMVHVHKVVGALREKGLRVYHYYKTAKWSKGLEFAERAGATSFVHPKLDVATGTLSYQVHHIPAKSKKFWEKEELQRMVDDISTRKG